MQTRIWQIVEKQLPDCLLVSCCVLHLGVCCLRISLGPNGAGDTQWPLRYIRMTQDSTPLLQAAWGSRPRAAGSRSNICSQPGATAGSSALQTNNQIIGSEGGRLADGYNTQPLTANEWHHTWQKPGPVLKLIREDKDPKIMFQELPHKLFPATVNSGAEMLLHFPTLLKHMLCVEFRFSSSELQRRNTQKKKKKKLQHWTLCAAFTPQGGEMWMWFLSFCLILPNLTA